MGSEVVMWKPGMVLNCCKVDGVACLLIVQYKGNMPSCSCTDGTIVQLEKKNSESSENLELEGVRILMFSILSITFFKSCLKV